MDDLKIRQAVQDELEFEPSIDAAHIGVAVDKGVALLSGHVKSYAEKIAAVEAAQRVSGVAAIADEMQVRFGDQPRTSDDEIAQRTADILKWHALVPGQAIKVAVRHGHVTLSGQVEWQYQRMAAEDAVRRLSHITGITNQIEVTPKASAGDIRTRIEAALKRHAEVEAKNIAVTVEGGTVTLQGHVDNLAEKSAVVTAAWSVPGVQRVHSNLTFA